MASQLMGDACAISGKYAGNDGQEKNRYVKLGVWFQNAETGALSIKLEALPIPFEGQAWISLFQKREEQPAQSPAPQQQAPQQQQRPAPAPQRGRY